MENFVYIDEDLTSSVKQVIKEQEERDLEAAQSSDIASIADQIDSDEPMDFGAEGDMDVAEDEMETVSMDFDALVSLVGEEKAQTLYDMCCEKGPSIPLTVADVEECCPELASEEMGEVEEEMEEAQEEMGEAEEEMEEAEEDIEGFDEEAGCDTGSVAAGTDIDMEAGEDACEVGEDMEAGEDACEVGEDMEAGEDEDAEDEDAEGGLLDLAIGSGNQNDED